MFRRSFGFSVLGAGVVLYQSGKGRNSGEICFLFYIFSLSVGSFHPDAFLGKKESPERRAGFFRFGGEFQGRNVVVCSCDNFARFAEFQGIGLVGRAPGRGGNIFDRIIFFNEIAKNFQFSIYNFQSISQFSIISVSWRIEN
jgi:hypothetical protein